MPGLERATKTGGPTQSELSLGKLSAEKEQAWATYMGRRRSYDDLISLVTDSSIQPQFQQRAMKILLTPDLSSIPFPTNTENTRNFIYTNKSWINKVTEKQAEFIAERIPEYIKEAERKLDSKDSNYYAKSNLDTYYRLILQLMKKLSPEKASELFKNFDVTNLVKWTLDENASSNPLKELYEDKAIDEVSKRKVADQMHEVIQKAKTMKTAINYCHLLGQISSQVGEKSPISRKFFQEEIAFVLGINTDTPVVWGFRTYDVLNLLDDEKLKHNFVRRQVLSKGDGFFDPLRVNDEKSAKMAEQILIDFPDDSDLKRSLGRQLINYPIRLKEREEELKKRGEEEQKLINPLRIK